MIFTGLRRAVTQQLYYDIMFDKHDFLGVIQRFGNIHSQEGPFYSSCERDVSEM